MHNNIKQLREKEKLSVQELARIISVAPPIIDAWELELDIPSLDHITSLCKYFNVTADELLKSERVEKVNFSHLDKKQKEIIYEVYNSFINKKL